MKLYILISVILATTLGQVAVKHPNHNYDPVEPDDHEAQASDGVPSIVLAPHHHPHSRQTPHNHPEVHHIPHHHPEVHQRPQGHHPEVHQRPQGHQPEVHPHPQAHQPQEFHQPKPTPHTEALKSYYPGRKRYQPPPKHRYHGPHRSKGHQKYHRRPQGHYQSIFGGRPGSKYPPRPVGNFGPRPAEHFGSRPQGHRPLGPPPSFITKPQGHHHPGLGISQGGFGGQNGLGSKPINFGGFAANSPDLEGHKPQGLESYGSKPSGVPNFGLGHHYEHKPSGLEVSGPSGYDPGHLGGGNDLSDEGGSVGSESHYVGTYEGGGGGDKWKGGGDVAGRVKIKVFRGPTQSDGHKHFAPWGYFVSQPNEETLTKASRPAYHGHY